MHKKAPHEPPPRTKQIKEIQKRVPFNTPSCQFIQKRVPSATRAMPAASIWSTRASMGRAMAEIAQTGLRLPEPTAASHPNALYGCGSKKQAPKWKPGKWKHGPTPA